MTFIDPDEIRSRFSRALSAMYREEVPAYGTLCDLVEEINGSVLAADSALKSKLRATDDLERLSEERHGAIRLGTPAELTMMARVFAVMGMAPVSYYDLSGNGVPVHSTAFRPITQEALAASPFRVFTSLLRTELIEDTAVRAQAEKILEARDIYPDELRALVEKAEKEGGLDAQNAATFIERSLDVFRWHEEANVDAVLYQQLKASHTLVADVVSFKGPHINHLTPRVLDIDELQRRMPEKGIDPKAVIEGPPGSIPAILLRQTSFKALTEPVKFKGEEGAHTARFGEVEQRGAALTREGRAMYDEKLAAVFAKVKPAGDGSNKDEYAAALQEKFSDFPQDFETLFRKKLAYGQYYITPAARDVLPENLPDDFEALLANGYIAVSPITYEDFLPASAAGIFQSNLGDDARDENLKAPSQEEFETHLGRAVYSEFDLYEAQQKESRHSVIKAINELRAA